MKNQISNICNNRAVEIHHLSQASLVLRGVNERLLTRQAGKTTEQKTNKKGSLI